MNNSKAKILVVDDDLRLRELLKRYLSEQGYSVNVAADADAMNRARTRERYDLLVLDLMMPGEDGLAICRRLRAGADATPIIMLTAKGDEIDRIVGLEMGADDYLPKPFNPRELLARIKAILRRTRCPITMPRIAGAMPASDTPAIELVNTPECARLSASAIVATEKEMPSPCTRASRSIFKA